MSRTLQPGNLISHYRVVGPLGAGGMGEVYLAHDLTLERNVALKILPRELVRNEERVRRFVLEAKSASSLSHPHIVTIHEIGKDIVRLSEEDHSGADGSGEPVHFIAMELVSGDTLKETIHQEKADLKALLGYLAQAAEGLAKAHAAGIVHRDLKPGNIMVTKDGYAKVLDFGLAKLTEKKIGGSSDATSAPTAAADLTGGGAVVGTVGYMSPEQVRGRAVDHRSDIFSFGCILYEAATRQRPFVADSDVETMHKILNEKPPAVDEVSPGVPAEVRRLIRRCLAKSPDQRFQSIKDVAIELREIVDEYDTLSASATSGTSVGLSGAAAPVRRRAGLIAGIAAAAIVGLGGIAVGVYGWLSGRGGPGGAAEPFQSMRMNSVTGGADLQTAVLSPDGRYLAAVRRADNRWSLKVRQVATGSEVQVLPPQEDQVRGLTFSPDGEYLHYLGRDPETPNYSALFEIPSLGGTARKRVFDVDSAVGFSPDGRRVAFIRGIPQAQESALVVFDLGSGTERLLAKVRVPESLPFVRPAWSPDGLRIVAVLFTLEGGVRAELMAFDAADGSRTPVGGTRFGPEIDSAAWLGEAGLAMSGFDLTRGFRMQLWRVGWPDGRSQRITNDLSDYRDVSASADGRTIAALRISRSSGLWNAPVEGGGEPRQLTTGSAGVDVVDNLRPAADGGILFTAGDDAGIPLWIMPQDGSGRRRISTDAQFVVFNVHSLADPPGVAFSAVAADLVPHVWRMGLDGGDAVQLTSGSGELLLAVSPDGGRLIYARTDSPRALWALPAAGGDPVKVADDAGDNPKFSPDGALLHFLRMTRSGDRFLPSVVVTPAGGGDPVATFVPPPRAGNVAWAPDGKGLTFVDEVDGVRTLLRWPLAGGEPAALFSLPEARMGNYEWSPDGRSLVVAATADQATNLWTWSAGEAKPAPITDFRSGEIFQFGWAADGRSVFFTQGTVNRDVVLVRSEE